MICEMMPAAAREGRQVPRSPHAVYEPSPTRADPVELLEFSKAYAKQNRSDYDALSRAVKSGRITAETGV
jgi:hypothetical protein